MENRIAIAKFINGDKIAHTESIWQYDYGQELKLEGLDLPSAFEVHFAKELHGNAVTSLYNSGSALIPDQLIQAPGTLFAWVYLHDTESDGETEYTIVIDVKKRAKPSHETPTPAQQSEIEQLIATLETAVEESETNVTHYPKIEDGYWYVWDAEAEDWENTGVEATGPQGEQGPQGPEGPEGPEGPAGADGYSPSASVSKVGATATITITDKDGTTTASISDGAALIDDTTTAQDSTWSSSKIDNTKMDKNNPTGSGSLSVGRQAGSTVGWGSVALGSGSAQATETNSFAFGNSAEALARDAVAMGYDCSASEMGSFALGYHVSAQGRSSHAEGEISVASGDYSHAEGYSSLARGDYQHVGGKFNLEDTTSAEIIGNGTDNLNRSNARTLDWNGNEKLAGKLTIGSDPTADMDVVPKAFMEQAIQDAVLSILPKKTVSGAVASFSDAQPDLPLVNLEAQIVPQQASGTPTPTSPLPISGVTSGTFTQAGKNMISDIQQGGIDATTGAETVSAQRVRTGFVKVAPNTTYTVAVNSSSASLVNFHILEYRQANASSYISYSNVTIATKTFTTGANTNFVRITARDTNNANITPSDLTKWQLELGSTATTYEPYNATTATAQFGQTVYGGTWKASEGKVVARPYYASYNGEALVGPWMSSMDVYAQGATPTIGAQVVDLGGTETEISVDAVNLTAQDGVNNIFADTGDSSVTYAAKIT